nr:auxin efflux carrier component 3 [Ipomoea batatas]
MQLHFSTLFVLIFHQFLGMVSFLFARFLEKLGKTLESDVVLNIDLFVDGSFTVVDELLAAKRSLRASRHHTELLLHFLKRLENNAGQRLVVRALGSTNHERNSISGLGRKTSLNDLSILCTCFCDCRITLLENIRLKLRGGRRMSPNSARRLGSQMFLHGKVSCGLDLGSKFSNSVLQIRDSSLRFFGSKVRNRRSRLAGVGSCGGMAPLPASSDTMLEYTHSEQRRRNSVVLILEMKAYRLDTNFGLIYIYRWWMMKVVIANSRKTHVPSLAVSSSLCSNNNRQSQALQSKSNNDAKELHMFVRSSSGLHVFGGADFGANKNSGRSDGAKEIRMLIEGHPQSGETKPITQSWDFGMEDYTFGKDGEENVGVAALSKLGSTSPENQDSVKISFG